MKDSPNLDLLRTLAVVFVVVSHLRYFVGWHGETVYSLETLGRLGVAIFFVHTTLVLLMSLQRTGETAGAFFIRRALRIYPLACSVVVLTALPGLFGAVPLDVGQFASNLLLVQNLTGHASAPQPLWSLPYEVQMYLFLPALFVFSRRGWRPMAVLCAGALLAALGLAAGGVEVRLLRYVPCFLPGALAFVLLQRAPRFGPGALFALVLAGVLLLPALVAAGVPETPLFWGFCLVLGITIPQCRQVESQRLASVGKVIATYSYGIYLTHVIALGFAFAGGRSGWPQWLVLAVMLPLLAWVSYRVIERPGIALGRCTAAAFTARGSRRPAQQPAALQPPATARP